MSEDVFDKIARAISASKLGPIDRETLKAGWVIGALASGHLLLAAAPFVIKRLRGSLRRREGRE